MVARIKVPNGSFNNFILGLGWLCLRNGFDSTGGPDDDSTDVTGSYGGWTTGSWNGGSWNGGDSSDSTGSWNGGDSSDSTGSWNDDSTGAVTGSWGRNTGGWNDDSTGEVTRAPWSGTTGWGRGRNNGHKGGRRQPAKRGNGQRSWKWTSPTTTP
ncbi:hypothetical protein M3Y97_01122300 [Aphelenchoides bicaudatus]|nr:hypothetical protein M3Y97_01122300 [Aphelenchoides bicaudatus]